MGGGKEALDAAAHHALDYAWGKALDLSTSRDFRLPDGSLDEVEYERARARILDTLASQIVAAAEADVMGQYDRALFEARRLTTEARHRLAVQLLAEMNPGTEDWLRDLARSGICGDELPNARGHERHRCALPAKHDGWHHDGGSGADWPAGEP